MVTEASSWQRLLNIAVALAGLGLALAGCTAPQESFAPVHGQVFAKGVPLPGGTIVFTPDPSRGGSGPSARAEIQPDGRYVLRTGNEYGAVPGWHRVTVVAVLPPGPASPGQRFSHPRSLLPVKYRDPELSDLHGEVKAGEDNTLDFNLD
jgi:hypothetical protein